jgi:hypothetical protein
MTPSTAARTPFSGLHQHDARVCGHELIPVLSRNLGAEEIQGWECIFCNERFENYSAARHNAEAVSAFAG